MASSSYEGYARLHIKRRLAETRETELVSCDVTLFWSSTAPSSYEYYTRLHIKRRLVELRQSGLLSYGVGLS
jgi:hypothetical protein